MGCGAHKQIKFRVEAEEVQKKETFSPQAIPSPSKTLLKEITTAQFGFTNPKELLKASSSQDSPTQNNPTPNNNNNTNKLNIEEGEVVRRTKARELTFQIQQPRSNSEAEQTARLGKQIAQGDDESILKNQLNNLNPRVSFRLSDNSLSQNDESSSKLTGSNPDLSKNSETKITSLKLDFNTIGPNEKKNSSLHNAFKESLFKREKGQKFLHELARKSSKEKDFYSPQFEGQEATSGHFDDTNDFVDESPGKPKVKNQEDEHKKPSEPKKVVRREMPRFSFAMVLPLNSTDTPHPLIPKDLVKENTNHKKSPRDVPSSKSISSSKMTSEQEKMSSNQNFDIGSQNQISDLLQTMELHRSPEHRKPFIQFSPSIEIFPNQQSPAHSSSRKQSLGLSYIKDTDSPQVPNNINVKNRFKMNLFELVKQDQKTTAQTQTRQSNVASSGTTMNSMVGSPLSKANNRMKQNLLQNAVVANNTISDFESRKIPPMLELSRLHVEHQPNLFDDDGPSPIYNFDQYQAMEFSTPNHRQNVLNELTGITDNMDQVIENVEDNISRIDFDRYELIAENVFVEFDEKNRIYPNNYNYPNNQNYPNNHNYPNNNNCNYPNNNSYNYQNNSNYNHQNNSNYNYQNNYNYPKSNPRFESDESHISNTNAYKTIKTSAFHDAHGMAKGKSIEFDQDPSYLQLPVGRDYILESSNQSLLPTQHSYKTGSSMVESGVSSKANDSYVSPYQRLHGMNGNGHIGNSGAHKGDAQRGDAQRGDVQRGDTQKGDAQRGDPQRGDVQKGDAQRGDAQRGDAQYGDPNKPSAVGNSYQRQLSVSQNQSAFQKQSVANPQNSLQRPGSASPQNLYQRQSTPNPQSNYQSQTSITPTGIQRQSSMSPAGQSVTSLQRQNTNTTNNSVVHTNRVDKTIDEEGKKKINQYIILKEIGKGGFGKVKLALNSDTQAIKIANKKKLQRKLFSRSKSAYTALESEIAIMKKMDHPNVVRLYEVIDDPTDDKLYLVMDYIKKGAVMSKTYWKIEDADTPKKTGNEPKLKPNCDMRFRQLLVHNHANVIHRDIKPENLLIDENDHLKISDFGISYIMEDGSDELTNNAGTKLFLAPEVWQGKKFKGKPADIWAAGGTLYYFLVGRAPFLGVGVDDLKMRICNENVTYPEDMNQDIIDLIEGTLQKVPEKRVSLEQIMKDKWLTKNGTVPLENKFEHAFVINDDDLKKAVGKVQFRARIWLTARMKMTLKQTREKLQRKKSNLSEASNFLTPY